MKKLILIFLLLAILPFISCKEENVIVFPVIHDNFIGNWNFKFRWNNGPTQNGIYRVKENGNVECTGQLCSENNPDNSFISRTWFSNGDKITITLKYRETNNNNILVTGNIIGTQTELNKINGTLNYSNGSTGTWTAERSP